MMTLTDEEQRKNWIEELSRQGLGGTAAQEVLIEVLSTVERPLSADNIWDAVQGVRPQTGRATTYRFIDKLTSLGLLQRVHGYRNCNTYIPSLIPHQALLVCTECGSVSELDMALQVRILAAIDATVNDLEMYHITSCHLQLLGTCIACQSNQP